MNIQIAQDGEQRLKSFCFDEKLEAEVAFDASVATVRSELPKFDDSYMHETWRLNAGDRELFAVPRMSFIRDGMLSHWYQHRGQFSVYLRLLNVAVPSTWGPSADELPAFMQEKAKVA